MALGYPWQGLYPKVLDEPENSEASSQKHSNVPRAAQALAPRVDQIKF